MIQQFEDRPSFAAQLARGGGRAAGAGLAQVGQELLKRRENEALAEREIDVPKNLSDEVRSMMIAEGLKRGALIKQSEASIPENLRKGTSQTNQPNQSAQQNQILQQNQAQAAPSINQAAQSAQESQNKPILTPEQMKQEARDRVYQKLSRNQPADYQDELSNLRAENQDNLNYRQMQNAAGNQARNALANVLPDATGEEGAVLAGKAEQYLQQGLSEAETDRKLQVDAKEYKNTVNRVENSIKAVRLGKMGKNAILGTGLDAEKAKQHLQLAVKPLLDMGQYDRARYALSKAGYGPEETETIVSNLSEPVVKTLAQMPKIKGQYKTAGTQIVKARESFAPDSQQAEQFRDNLKTALTEDPNANLILLRKAYMDKGVDWRNFLYAIDDLRASGEFQANNDQDKALERLVEPPLHELDKVLFGLKIIGK